jgi:hypothetical protein
VLFAPSIEGELIASAQPGGLGHTGPRCRGLAGDQSACASLPAGSNGFATICENEPQIDADALGYGACGFLPHAPFLDGQCRQRSKILAQSCAREPIRDRSRCRLCGAD